MTPYKVKALRLGQIVRPVTNMIYDCGIGLPAIFPLIAYYLENEKHKIMIDTGGTAPDGIHWQPYERDECESMEAQLAALDINPAEVDTVILTHLHWDHAGNNEVFPNAVFIAQKTECADLTLPGMDAEVLRRTTFMQVDGDTELYEGIRLILTPGHSPGMQCILAETTEGPRLFTGDLIPTFDNWNKTPKIPTGGVYDLNVAKASIEKIAGLCDNILPGHDERVFSKV